MAKKCNWEGKPAYEEGPLILQLQDEGWVVIHKKTTNPIMGFKPYKQKKDALRYATNLINKMNLEFTTKEGMSELNGGFENATELRNQAYWEGTENE